MNCIRIIPIIAAWLLLATAQAAVEKVEVEDNIRAMEWREVGPYRGGRSAAAVGIPADRDIYYFGATGGGVWKTGNGGTSWANVSDGYFGGSVGAVAVSEWDPNVVYVGLGEKTVRGNVSPGDGMWKSSDAGSSWQRIGLLDSQHISRIRIHPKNPELVYAAVMGHLFGPNEERGVFRSKNGGESWEKILYVNEHAGAVDLAMDPTNPRILYASFWRVKRTPYSLESGGEGSGIWKSTDGGDSWEELTENEGLPSGPIGISGIAVSPANNQNLYAMIEAKEGGVFRSRDGGKTWARVNESRDLRQRAWYYSRIYADPVDEDSLYVLNVQFHFSKDGGKSFSKIETPHGDNHDLWIDPNDPLRMIQSNDGGANVSYDRGLTWSVQSNQPTAQMYRVSTDNAFPYRLLGGQQDNSAIRIRSRSAFGNSIGARDWEPTAGSESGHIVAKPDNPEIVVGGSYGGYLSIFDHASGNQRAIDVWPDNPMGWGAAELKHRFQWNFPILFSQHDPDVLYVAAEALFRSRDLGETWETVSPDLTRNDPSTMGSSGGPITKDNTSVEYYGTIFAVAESSHDSQVIWAGSDDGLVHLTRDGGASWDNVTPSNLPEWAQVNSIEAHPFEPGGAYIAATRYKSDDFQPYLFRTTDWGKSWKKIVGGIPNSHFTRVIRADPDRRGLVYAGTEYGIYYSSDDGALWKPLQLNLPLVPITDLAIKNQDLIAATQGRGYWILDDLSVLHQSSEDIDSSEIHLFEPRQSYRLLAGGRAKDPGDAGTNPPVGVVFHYSLGREAADSDELSLEIFAAGTDQPIWTWARKKLADGEPEKAAGPNDPPDLRQLSVDKGLNRFVWDLRYPGMQRFDGLIMWSDMKEGPRAVPGTYRARLTLNGAASEAEFVVLADPRSNATPDDFQAQFDFIISSRDLLSRTHEEIRKIHKLREQLKVVQGKLKSSDEEQAPSELDEQLSALGETLDRIEQALYQTQNKSSQDPLNYPVRLNNKLTSLMQTVDAGDNRPSGSAIAVRDALAAEIEEQLDLLNEVWNQTIPELNQSLRSLEIDHLRVAQDM